LYIFYRATRSDGASFKDYTKNVREAKQKAKSKDAARTKKINKKD